MTAANWDQLITDAEASERFWRSVDARAMELPFCRVCDHAFFYPRPRCPRCWSADLEWRAVAGGGTVTAFSIVRYALQRGPWAERVPYVVALIDLDEEVRVLSNVVGCAPEAVTVGMPVTLSYASLDDRVLYVFEPA